MEIATNSQVRFKKQLYGLLIVGPPGSGKTTYCSHAYDFYKNLGRKIAVVNLDPANENMEYEAQLDVMQLITVSDVMESLNLGPNGALMFCAEYLEEQFNDFLLPQLNKLTETCNYFIFDCPGQVELYTHHTSMSNIFKKIEEMDFHLVTVNLIDSHYCSEPDKFVSTLLLALNMMMRMGLPHVNVLSKADLLRKHREKLHFSLEYYTEVLDLSYLLEALEETPGMMKFQKLNAAICSLVEDYSLVSFQLLNVRSNLSMLRLRDVIDKANYYVYRAGEEAAVNSLLASTYQSSDRQEKDFDPFVEQ